MKCCASDQGIISTLWDSSINRFCFSSGAAIARNTFNFSPPLPSIAID